jgi:hypothetical protein
MNIATLGEFRETGFPACEASKPPYFFLILVWQTGPTSGTFHFTKEEAWF